MHRPEMTFFPWPCKIKKKVALQICDTEWKHCGPKQKKGTSHSCKRSFFSVDDITYKLSALHCPEYNLTTFVHAVLLHGGPVPAQPRALCRQRYSTDVNLDFKVSNAKWLGDSPHWLHYICLIGALHTLFYTTLLCVSAQRIFGCTTFSRPTLKCKLEIIASLQFLELTDLLASTG